VNRLKPLLLPAVAVLLLAGPARAQIAASHVYHNHMPNFWAYYDVSKYASTPVGGAIRYTYDGQVINLKQNPPSNYTYYLPSGAPMPHDDLVTYYSHHAKTGAYLYWPPSVAADMNTNAPTRQVHVTMSGAVVNNVQDLNALQNVLLVRPAGAPLEAALRHLEGPVPRVQLGHRPHPGAQDEPQRPAGGHDGLLRARLALPGAQLRPAPGLAQLREDGRVDLARRPPQPLEAHHPAGQPGDARGQPAQPVDDVLPGEG